MTARDPDAARAARRTPPPDPAPVRSDGRPTAPHPATGRAPAVEPLLTVWIPGPIVGKARPRVTRHGAHMPDQHRAYERSCVALLRAHWRRPALDEAVTLRLDVWMPRPKRLRRVADRGLVEPYTGKPDADNAAGIPMDALCKAGVLVDDTRIADLDVRRRYVPLLEDGRDAFAPCTWITLTRWSP